MLPARKAGRSDQNWRIGEHTDQAIALRTCVTINPLRMTKFRSAGSMIEPLISLLARKETSGDRSLRVCWLVHKATGEVTEDHQVGQKQKKLCWHCDTRRSFSIQSSSTTASRWLSRSMTSLRRNSGAQPYSRKGAFLLGPSFSPNATE
jgi:hypothetical protein